jgi:hypothetical protein
VFGSGITGPESNTDLSNWFVSNIISIRSFNFSACPESKFITLAHNSHVSHITMTSVPNPVTLLPMNPVDLFPLRLFAGDIIYPVVTELTTQ